MSALPARRPPPPFVPVAVRRITPLSPRMARVTFAGEGAGALTPDLPAASVRLLLPPADGAGLVIPTWDGNVFLLPDGSRAPIRTLTPLRVEGDEIDVAVVLHGAGRLGGWVEQAVPGSPAAFSGPGRGHLVDADAARCLLAGDESAIPAITQLLGHLSPTSAVEVMIEVAHPDARLDLPPHPAAEVRWIDLPAGGSPGDALVAAFEGRPVGGDDSVWVAGEAAAMFRIRKLLFDGLGHPRRRASVRGYWKAGRAGDAGDPG